MILITSGAYVENEFVNEIGLIPPSFLPVQNKRLYELQIDYLRNTVKDNDIYLSIPESYVISDYDTSRLKELEVTVLRSPDNLSLGESIVYCWNSAAAYFDSLKIFHGDSLFIDTILSEENELTIHENKGFYRRASSSFFLDEMDDSFINSHDDWFGDGNLVLSGYFSFSKPLEFIKSLLELKSDFIAAIKKYHKKQKLHVNSSGKWLDFGHINSYFNSRTHLTTQRAFNALTVHNRKITKHSNRKSKKIYAEGNWFQSIPLNIKHHTPHLLDIYSGKDNNNKDAFYSLEYLYLLPLSDLFVFGELPSSAWKSIFYALKQMIVDFYQFFDSNIQLHELNSLYLDKTLSRLDELCRQHGINYKQKHYQVGNSSMTLYALAEDTAKYISQTRPEDVAISHGDLCFSNILFDNRTHTVKCIDPRGLDQNGNLSIYGDKRYDLAKLYHSVCGYYDIIISGRYKLDDKFNITFDIKSNTELLEANFNEVILSDSGYSEREILAITIHLFISMIPLHYEDETRQQAFIANAFRLYKKLKNKDA